MIGNFLNRWRFLSVFKNENGEETVLFTPNSGSTVFFGNLSIECTENDIYKDLKQADESWAHASVRLKLGKGFAYAFVDFPSRFVFFCIFFFIFFIFWVLFLLSLEK